MDDLLFDTIIEEQATPTPPPLHRRRAPAPSADMDTTEEDLLAAAELGYSVYSLHGSPQPLELMRILASVDNTFLKDQKSVSVESYYLSHLSDIFFS